MGLISNPVYVAVIGGGDAPPDVTALAREVGRELARRGAIVICGGLGGVMAAAAQGVKEAGGVSLGILPDPDRARANPYLTYSIVTNLGFARNLVIVHSAQALIAVDGSYGTISEAAMALKIGKPVIALNVSWDLPGLRRAATPQEAVSLAWAALEGGV
ncbi:MAG: TIGR00725 family protein [Thermodesulfobacteriota bacterium]